MGAISPIPVEERPPCPVCGTAKPTSEGRKSKYAWLWKCRNPECAKRYTVRVKPGVIIEALRPKEPDLLRWMKRVIRDKIDDDEPEHIKSLRAQYQDEPQKFLDRMAKMEAGHARAVNASDAKAHALRNAPPKPTAAAAPAPVRTEPAAPESLGPDEGQERVEELIERLLIEVRQKVQAA